MDKPLEDLSSNSIQLFGDVCYKNSIPNQSCGSRNDYNIIKKGMKMCREIAEMPG